MDSKASVYRKKTKFRSIATYWVSGLSWSCSHPKDIKSFGKWAWVCPQVQKLRHTSSFQKEKLNTSIGQSRFLSALVWRNHFDFFTFKISVSFTISFPFFLLQTADATCYWRFVFYCCNKAWACMVSAGFYFQVLSSRELLNSPLFWQENRECCHCNNCDWMRMNL